MRSQVRAGKQIFTKLPEQLPEHLIGPQKIERKRDK